MFCVYFSSEKAWSKEDKAREKHLMSDLVTIIEQRNQIINSLDQDRQRWANYISGPVSFMTSFIQSMCGQTYLFVVQVVPWRSPFTGIGDICHVCHCHKPILESCIVLWFLRLEFDIVEKCHSSCVICAIWVCCYFAILEVACIACFRYEIPIYLDKFTLCVSSRMFYACFTQRTRRGHAVGGHDQER